MKIMQEIDNTFKKGADEISSALKPILGDVEVRIDLGINIDSPEFVFRVKKEGEHLFYGSLQASTEACVDHFWAEYSPKYYMLLCLVRQRHVIRLKDGYAIEGVCTLNSPLKSGYLSIKDGILVLNPYGLRKDGDTIPVMPDEIIMA